MKTKKFPSNQLGFRKFHSEYSTLKVNSKFSYLQISYDVNLILDKWIIKPEFEATKMTKFLSLGDPS